MEHNKKWYRDIRNMLVCAVVMIGIMLQHTYAPDIMPKVNAENVIVTQSELETYYTYEVIDEEEKTIRLTGLTDNFGPVGRQILIPDHIGEYQVVALGDALYKLLSNVDTVVVPEGITEIGENCFDYCGIQSVTLPSTLKTIKASAFEECKNLVSITIPNGVTSIGEAAFYNCTSLTNVILPKSCTTMGNAVFRLCTALETITFPEGWKEVPYATFWLCEKLKNVYLPESMEVIGEGAFGNCTALETIELPAAVTTLERKAFTGCIALSEVTLSEELTTIREEVFPANAEAVTLVIPGDMDEVESLGLENLTNVTFEIAEGSNVIVYFVEMDVDVEYIIVDAPTTEEDTTEEDTTKEDTTEEDTTEEDTTEEDSTEEDTTEEDTTEGTTTEEETTEEAATEDTTEEDTTEEETTEEETTEEETAEEEYKIGHVYKKGKMKYRITTKKTVTFVGCTNKKRISLVIPATVKFGEKTYKVTAIGKSACKGYKRLKYVQIGKNVKVVKNNAFMNCKALREITFGKGVVKIGKKVLYGDKNLELIKFKTKKLKSIGKKTFRKVPKTATIVVPKGKAKKYKKLIDAAK